MDGPYDQAIDWNAAGKPGHLYWQQRADYNIEIRLDDEKQRISGSETITYYNNSPDVLDYLWIQLDQNILTEIQMEHTSCQPFYFAVELEPDLITFELLIRTKKRIRCDCMGYATETQRNWLIRLADSIFDTLEIKT